MSMTIILRVIWHYHTFLISKVSVLSSLVASLYPHITDSNQFGREINAVPLFSQVEKRLFAWKWKLWARHCSQKRWYSTCCLLHLILFFEPIVFCQHSCGSLMQCSFFVNQFKYHISQITLNQSWRYNYPMFGIHCPYFFITIGLIKIPPNCRYNAICSPKNFF